MKYQCLIIVEVFSIVELFWGQGSFHEFDEKQHILSPKVGGKNMHKEYGCIHTE